MSFLSQLGGGLSGAVDKLGNGIENWLNAPMNAANAQVAAANTAMGQAQQGYGQALQEQQPYLAGGTNAFNAWSDNTQNAAYQSPLSAAAPDSQGAQNISLANQPFNFQSSPGYQFQIQQGEGAINNSAAANGSGLSGATLRALQRYGTGLAAQDYSNQFNIYNTNRGYNANMGNTLYGQQTQQNQQRYQNMGTLAGVGQSAANASGQLASNQGNTLAGITGQKGQAQAGGIIGQANQITGLLQAGQGMALGIGSLAAIGA